MTRRNSIAFVNLSLCAMLALLGCKSSNPLGLADKSAPAATQAPDQGTTVANSQLALNKAAETPAVPKEPTLTDEPGDGFSLARTFKSATSWLPFQNRDDQEGRETRALDRELTLRPPPTSTGRFGATPTNASPKRDSVTNPANYTPGDWRTGALTRPDAARSTPSLVRHSRRPPPDPAPKPPQEELLAKKTLPRNSATTTQHVSLARKIVTASRAWQVDMAKAKTTAVAATTATQPKPKPKSDNSGLKFVPPQIAKKQADDKSADLAKTNKSGPPKDLVKKPKSRNTIPRRSDMIVGAQRPSKPDAKTELASNTKAPAKETKDSRPGTKWIAKKSDPPAKPSAPTIERETPKSVVAEAFAARQPVPNAMAQAKPDTAQRAHPVRSEFPLNNPLANHPRSPQYITNPHTRGPQPTTSLEPKNTVAQTPKVGVGQPSSTHTPQQPATSPMSVRPTTPQTQPTQLANSSLPPARPEQVAPTTRLARPNTAWRQPVPFAPSGQNSYQAYYHRGTVPKSGAAPQARQPQQPMVTAVQPAYGTMQMPENVAPLIDADAYRQQRSGAVIPVTTPQPAPRGTWLATYQRLMQRDRNYEQPTNASAGTGATRSLSSGQ